MSCSAPWEWRRDAQSGGLMSESVGVEAASAARVVKRQKGTLKRRREVSSFVVA